MNFKVVIKEDLEDGGYNVSCPALQGCHSQGDTIEEAVDKKTGIIYSMAFLSLTSLQVGCKKLIEVD